MQYMNTTSRPSPTSPLTRRPISNISGERGARSMWSRCPQTAATCWPRRTSWGRWTSSQASARSPLHTRSGNKTPRQGQRSPRISMIRTYAVEFGIFVALTNWSFSNVSDFGTFAEKELFSHFLFVFPSRALSSMKIGWAGDWFAMDGI